MSLNTPNIFKAGEELDIPEPFLRFIVSDRAKCLNDCGTGVITLYDSHAPEHYDKIEDDINHLLGKFMRVLDKRGLFPNFAIGHAHLWTASFDKTHGKSIKIAVFDQSKNIGMHRGVFAWFANGERDKPSETIALAALGYDINPNDARPPSNPQELRRCMLLMRQVPNVFEAGALRLARSERKWARTDWAHIINKWADLTTSLVAETGEALDYSIEATGTQKMLEGAAYS